MATAIQAVTATPTAVTDFDSGTWDVQNRGPGPVRYASATTAPAATSNVYKEFADGQVGRIETATGEHAYFWKSTRTGPSATIAYDEVT